MKLKMIRKGILLSMLLQLLLAACSGVDMMEANPYRIVNVKIYKNTPAWELAKAVKQQNVKKIARIAAATPELLDYQDPVYGSTLLYWSVGMEKYESAEALLKAGANPNIISDYEGGTALYRAAGYSFIDSDAKKDAKYVKLLLQYGADPNIGYVGSERDNSTEIGTTPLMESILCGIDKTKALVEAGADINYRTQDGESAATNAIRMGGPNSTIEAMRYAHYLIVEQHADVTGLWITASGEGIAPVAFLRKWMVELDSEEYRLKMEIVEACAKQGEDYWETEILQRELDSIKRRFPDTWEEYIKVY